VLEEAVNMHAAPGMTFTVRLVSEKLAAL